MPKSNSMRVYKKMPLHCKLKFKFVYMKSTIMNVYEYVDFSRIEKKDIYEKLGIRVTH